VQESACMSQPSGVTETLLDVLMPNLWIPFVCKD
jgi:hypothetical protein